LQKRLPEEIMRERYRYRRGMMIEPLQRVLEQVEQLTPDEQAHIAEEMQRVLEKLEASRWTELLNDPRSPALLDRLADEARA
jgi:diadenosine tetraphosphate (Ap4A) HIT family hydrolase